MSDPSARSPFSAFTEEELKAAVDAAADHSTRKEAARALGISVRALYRRLATAASRGLDGSTPGPVPEGQRVKGVSQFHSLDRATGEMQLVAQWTKTEREGPTREDLIEAVRSVASEIKGTIPAKRWRGGVWPDERERFVIFPWPDLHMGMLSWGEETGENWDLSLADGMIREAMQKLVARAPRAGEAVLLGLGDLLHFDDDRQETNRSGHKLDGDGRHTKIRRVTMKLLIWAVRLLLERYPRVTVRLLAGNHDERSAGPLSEALALFFDAEPRVAVDCDPSLWWFFRRGVCLIGATHGHTIKPERMPGHMVRKCKADYGETDVHRIFHGHWHNRSRIRDVEEMGIPVECLQTVVPADAWHDGAGYGAGRSLMALTFHARLGEEGRSFVNIVKGEPV